MKKVIDVQAGEVKAGHGGIVFKSRAIGSCIAIAAYDSNLNVGALAHVMLPGRAPAYRKPTEKTKYAADAIDAIINKMAELGSKTECMDVALVGGGNVLEREDDTICADNIESTQQLLKERQVKIRACALGGMKRRSISLDLDSGIVSYSEGDSGELELWRPKPTGTRADSVATI